MARNMGDAIVGVQNIIGYIFTDPSILWEALQAPGSGVLMSGNRVLSSEGNKRMALVGDAWLKMAIITEWLAENLPKAIADERLQKLASNDKLQRICKTCGLDKFINQNPSQRGVISPRTRFDTMEAIIGAVGQDGGLDAVRSVVKTLHRLTINSEAAW